jgi:hypothetical protein
MNPLHWKREHQIAFLVAALFGTGIGIFVGLRQVEPSSELYWLHAALWGAAGSLLAAIGAFIRQMVRNRKIK